MKESEFRKLIRESIKGVLNGETKKVSTLESLIESCMIELSEEIKKPSFGLNKKEKSKIVKKARSGKSVGGKKGEPSFEKGVKAIEKNTGKSEEEAKKIKGAVMWKKLAKKKK
jgi:hypothetical protein